MSSSGCGYGSGFSSTPSTTLKIAELAPMPMASVTTATLVNIGICTSRRRICLSRIEGRYGPGGGKFSGGS